MKEQPTHEIVLNFACDVGELMLRSGAEISRVEDTISRILLSHNYHKVDAFVIPTGIIVTIEDNSFPMCTKVSRVKNRSTRLDRVELLNQLSRDYVQQDITLSDALSRLDTIKNVTSYSPLTLCITTGLSASFLSLTFNGHLIDFLLAFVMGALVGYFRYHLSKRYSVNYFVLFICAFLAGLSVSLLSILLSDIFLLGNILNVDTIITCIITPLLPGVAFTNSVRDAIGDELLSGISRAVEAILVAVFIAAGIGVALAISFYIRRII